MTYRRVLVACVLLLCLSGFTAAQATEGVETRVAVKLSGIKGSDDRVRVDSTAMPWTAIGRVNRTSGGFCTGVLIAPNKAITAAHCLWNKATGRWFQPHSLFFLAGYQRGHAPKTAGVVDYVLPSGAVGPDGARIANPMSDWAVLMLDTDVGTSMGILPLVSFDRLRHLRLVREHASFLHAGYSQDRPHMLMMHPGCAVTGFREGEAITLHDCDATHGDSGSPILVKEGGKYSIAAIHVATLEANGEAHGVAISGATILAGFGETRSRRSLPDVIENAAEPPAE